MFITSTTFVVHLKFEWGIVKPQPEVTGPFYALRALSGRPRAIERSSRPEGGLKVPKGHKMCPVTEG